MTHSFEIYRPSLPGCLNVGKPNMVSIRHWNYVSFPTSFRVFIFCHDPEKQNLVLSEFSDLSFAYEPHAVIPRMFVLHDGKGFIKTKAFQRLDQRDRSRVSCSCCGQPFFRERLWMFVLLLEANL